MFIYAGKRFDAMQIGSVVVGVTCDECGCEYFYELTRSGTGAGSAPYGIGSARAARSAQEHAERDLQQRLTAEADLVPCPNCHWINDELIRGYRLGRYRWLVRFAAGLGIVGTASCLIAAWFISRSPIPGDRELSIKVLIVGPLSFALFFAGMFLLRNLLRSRIRPNQHFPQAPKVPVGSARALLTDQDGQLRLADPLDVTGGVDFPMDRLQLPAKCCACLEPANPVYAYHLPVSLSTSLEIARCAACARRARRTCLFLFLPVVAFGLAFGGAGIAWLDSLTLRILIGVFLPVYAFLAFALAAALTAPAKIVAGERPPGIVRLQFRNADYARVVAEHVSESDLHM